MPEIHGHRGARALRPENTLPGLACALAIGVDAIEFDVTLTADGGLILAHDLVVSAETTLDTAPATEGDPDFPYVGRPWTALTLSQIATLDAGGRRPVTIPAAEADCPVLHATPDGGRLEYREGLLIGYRGYDHAGTRPRFAFGHGLGYTTWAYESAAADTPMVKPDGPLLSNGWKNCGLFAGITPIASCARISGVLPFTGMLAASS